MWLIYNGISNHSFSSLFVKRDQYKKYFLEEREQKLSGLNGFPCGIQSDDPHHWQKYLYLLQL